jgi:hypothetical protein
MTGRASRIETTLVLAAALAIFAGVHLPLDVSKDLFGLSPPDARALRGVLFGGPVIVAILVLAFRLARLPLRKLLDWRVAAGTVAVSGFLAVLGVPNHPRSYGSHLARIAVAPFNEVYSVLHRRLFHVFMANSLGATTPETYTVLGIVLGLVFFYLVWVYLFGPGTSRVPFTQQALVMASLGTCAFIFYGYQYPGYADVTAFICFMLLVLLPLDDVAQCILVILALATSEGSSWVLGPLIVLVLPRGNRIRCLAILALYWAVWLATMRFDLIGIISKHTGSGSKSGFVFLMENKASLVLGIFFSYKLWWALLVAMVVALRDQPRLLLTAAALFFCSFLMLPLIDTSRLMGWGYLGLLLLAREYFARRPPGAAFLAVAALSILVPSYYFGTNIGCQVAPGLYQEMTTAVGSNLPFRCNYMH